MDLDEVQALSREDIGQLKTISSSIVFPKGSKHTIQQMAGPGKKGHIMKRQCQEQQITKNLESLGGSNKNSSMSTNSNTTNNQTPISSPMTNNNGGQPQTSESHASGNNEIVLIIGGHENAFENHEAVPTSGASESNWIWLCDYFTSENFQKRKKGVKLSEIDLYEFSRHSKKKGGLVNDKLKETLEKIKELKAKTSMTTKEICRKRVGYIPGQVNSCSASKKQADEIVEQLRTEMEENMRRADTAEQRAVSIYEQFKNLEERQRETKELDQQLLPKLNELSK
ncbi:hypothetical protein ACH5RR_008979 [Cinchona calisaya]|uniref:Uncharacterized protein n=1 Tax=Cinchona calisaya TaxID=153742 RepID=A0ABD3AFW5_9GENT